MNPLKRRKIYRAGRSDSVAVEPEAQQKPPTPTAPESSATEDTSTSARRRRWRGLVNTEDG